MNGRAYYNENDPFAAQWLRNLIAAGHIAPGDVDERSIVDVKPDDLAGYTQCHFFAGIGGWSYALRLAGWPDDRPVWTGSCPCQPFSLAGKQKGFADERHLWPVWRELIRERSPATVFGEQVASATQWLGLVRSDLEAMGYAVGAMPIQAASAGADHLRDRFWFVADASLSAEERQRQYGWKVLSDQATDGRDGSGNMGHAGRAGLEIGSITEVERRNLRSQGPTASASGHGSHALADANESRASEEWTERSWEFCGAGRDTRACDCRDLADSMQNRDRAETARCSGSEEASWFGSDEETSRSITPAGIDSSDLTWVIGADGKARRVKPGIRLLAHGIPARMGKLRAFGNAIVPQVAAQFIIAASEALP